MDALLCARQRSTSWELIQFRLFLHGAEARRGGLSTAHVYTWPWLPSHSGPGLTGLALAIVQIVCGGYPGQRVDIELQPVAYLHVTRNFQ